ncbi:hypothetical protein HK103_001154 [Boothiomyces macroporosus]|uniref:Beta-lactamase-related domain-containing protein n=1 Tax=Boothiomyces macroporosus TaxID=261099 RepID=A0AAD5Y5J6_9FUNG|nr:hypothetical protein HK103_001154 [Boothiomyces macroporosus]
MDQKLLEIHNNGNFGVSAATISNGHISYQGALGYSRIPFLPFFPKPKVTNETRFQAASISKPVTMFAVLRLVDQGLLDLDADIDAYLAETGFELDYNKDLYKSKPKVTLRMLLSHTAGLTVHGFYGYSKNKPIPSIQQILLGQKPANSDKVMIQYPQGEFKYSGGGKMFVNLGTTLVQYIMETVTKKPFHQIMFEQVLKPSGMIHSTFETDLSNGPHLSNANFNIYHPWMYFYGISPYAIHPEKAAAGLWTTATDLCLFGIQVMKAINHEYGALLSPILADQIMKTYNSNVKETEMGLGFFRSSQDLTISHGGGNSGYRCYLLLKPSINSGVCVMRNHERFGNELVQMLQELAGSVDVPVPSDMSVSALPSWMEIIQRYIEYFKYMIFGI